MFATTHVIIGGAAGWIVGQTTSNPALAISAATGAGIVSHLIGDLMPHIEAPFDIEYENGILDRPIWTRKLLLFALSDSVLAFLLTLFVWYRLDGLSMTSPLAWGALGGYLPDFLDVVPFWAPHLRRLPGFKQFHALHIYVHQLWRKKFPMNEHWKLGVMTQVGYVAAVMLLCTILL